MQRLRFMQWASGLKKDDKDIPADLYLAVVTNYFVGFPAFAADTFKESLEKIFAHPDYQAIVKSIGDRTRLPLDPVLSAEEQAQLPGRDDARIGQREAA